MTEFERIRKKFIEGKIFFHRYDVDTLLKRIAELEKKSARVMDEEQYKAYLQMVNENEIMLKLERDQE